VIALFTVTEDGPFIVIARSADALTVVLVLAVLFAVLGSDTSPVTIALLVIVPGAEGTVVGVILIVTVALAPLARFPRAQVRGALPLQLPWLAAEDIRLIPTGRVSVKITPVSATGPSLVTVML
jgi:hypothetical protein